MPSFVSPLYDLLLRALIRRSLEMIQKISTFVNAVMRSDIFYYVGCLNQ